MPDCTEKDPECDVVVSSPADDIVSDPLLPVVLAPLRKLSLPPFAFMLVPAVTATEPPRCALLLPTEILIDPLSSLALDPV